MSQRVLVAVEANLSSITRLREQIDFRDWTINFSSREASQAPPPPLWIRHFGGDGVCTSSTLEDDSARWRKWRQSNKQSLPSKAERGKTRNGWKHCTTNYVIVNVTKRACLQLRDLVFGVSILKRMVTWLIKNKHSEKWRSCTTMQSASCNAHGTHARYLRGTHARVIARRRNRWFMSLFTSCHGNEHWNSIQAMRFARFSKANQSTNLSRNRNNIQGRPSGEHTVHWR